MPDDGRLASTRGTEQVNAVDRTTIGRLADGEELRVVGEGSMEVTEELVVGLDLVIRLEVGKIREASREASRLVGSYMKADV